MVPCVGDGGGDLRLIMFLVSFIYCNNNRC